MNDRLTKLQEKLAEFEVDGILITNPENRYYISGFSGSAGYLFITPDAAYLNTDFRYIEQATNQAPSFEIIKIDSELKWFIDLLGIAPICLAMVNPSPVLWIPALRIRRSDHSPI